MPAILPDFAAQVDRIGAARRRGERRGGLFDGEDAPLRIHQHAVAGRGGDGDGNAEGQGAIGRGFTGQGIPGQVRHRVGQRRAGVNGVMQHGDAAQAVVAMGKPLVGAAGDAPCIAPGNT
ncbi:hypothetical protein G6F66_014933 [Rhizopus arrhizus]|nr:hypothetical protein G6F66_014933 [Rhizopus arrhizus]